MADQPVSFKVSKAVEESLKKIGTDGRKVQVVGQMKGGKLEIDSNAIAELNRRFPRAQLSFVAVNAPFAACRSAAE